MGTAVVGGGIEIGDLSRESHDFDDAASAYPERLRLIMDWFDAHRR
jgi:hypothetical protein